MTATKQATKRVRKVKLSEEEMLSAIRTRMLEVMKGAAVLFSASSDDCKDYLRVSTLHLATAVTDAWDRSDEAGESKQVYLSLAEPIAVNLFTNSGKEDKFFTFRKTNSGRFLEAMLGTDVLLPSNTGPLDIENCVYPDNITLWAMLVALQCMTGNVVLTRSLHGSTKFYVLDVHIIGALSAIADAPSAPLLSPARSLRNENEDFGDDEDEDDEDDDEEALSIKLRMGGGYREFNRTAFSKAVASIKKCTPLPIVFFKKHIVSKEAIADRINCLLGSEARSIYNGRENGKDYSKVLIHNSIVEGVHFNIDNEVETFVFPEDSLEDAAQYVESEEVQYDLGFSNNPSKELLPTVCVDRYIFSPSDTSLNVAGIISLVPTAASVEEAIKLMIDKELTDLLEEEEQAVSEIKSLRLSMQAAHRNLARAAMKVKALRNCYQTNFQFAIDRLKNFSFESVKVSEFASVMIQTGPIFGHFNSKDGSFSVDKFYVGNFQIVASLINSDFCLRNIAAPLVATKDSGSWRLAAVAHPHSYMSNTRVAGSKNKFVTMDYSSDICWGSYEGEFNPSFVYGDNPIADEFENRIRTLLAFLTSANKNDGYVGVWKDILLPEVPEVTTVTKWDRNMVAQGAMFKIPKEWATKSNPAMIDGLVQPLRKSTKDSYRVKPEEVQWSR